MKNTLEQVKPFVTVPITAVYCTKSKIQKELCEGIHRKTPVLGSLFNEAAGQRDSNKVFSSEYYKVFKNCCSMKNTPGGCFSRLLKNVPRKLL